MIDCLQAARTFCLSLSLVFASNLAVPAQAQDWVKAMFSENSHDFGTVARGAKAEFSFVLENKYEEDVHIAGVRSSCNCTTPRIKDSKDVLKTYEKGAIVCEFNTRSFIGPKAAVVTVIFDRPFYGEMQLNVKGNIRSDIETNPGEIQFGELARGTEKKTSVKISYRGRNAWEIVDVRSTNTHLGVTLDPISKTPGNIEYQMNVRLKPEAPAGSFNDQIVLVTNESQYNLVTVPVRGTIQPPLVMANSVELGTTPIGKKISKRVIIKGQEPFEITDIECDDERFSFQIPPGARKAHIIPLVFDSGESSGAFRVKLTVATNLESENTASTFVSGNVVE